VLKIQLIWFADFYTVLQLIIGIQYQVSVSKRHWKRYFIINGQKADTTFVLNSVNSSQMFTVEYQKLPSGSFCPCLHGLRKSTHY